MYSLHLRNVLPDPQLASLLESIIEVESVDEEHACESPVNEEHSSPIQRCISDVSLFKAEERSAAAYATECYLF